MLEVVGVDVAIGQGDVRRVPVGELHQLDLEALLGGLLHRHFQGRGEGGSGAELEGLVGGLGDAAGQQQSKDQGFEGVLGHGFYPWVMGSGRGSEFIRDGRRSLPWESGVAPSGRFANEFAPTRAPRWSAGN